MRFLFALLKKCDIKKEQLICVLPFKGSYMDNLNRILESISQPAKGKATPSRKRKWREIEQIRDKFQLEKELKAYEDSLEHMLEEF